MPMKKAHDPKTFLFPRHRMAEADAADDRLAEDMKQTIEATYRVLKDRSSHAYDGILGSLYEDWPQHFHIAFEATRNKLLNKCSHADALGYLKDFPRYFDKNYNGRLLMPVSIQSLVGDLHYYYCAMRLGKDKGLSKLIGSTVAGHAKEGKKFLARQSRIARNPRGRVGDDGKYIKQIIGELAQSVEQADEGARDLWPHFFSKLDENGLHPEEIDHATESAKSQYKYDFKDGRKSMSFGRFENIVTQQRRKRKSR